MRSTSILYFECVTLISRCIWPSSALYKHPCPESKRGQFEQTSIVNGEPLYVATHESLVIKSGCFEKQSTALSDEYFKECQALIKPDLPAQFRRSSFLGSKLRRECLRRQKKESASEPGNSGNITRSPGAAPVGGSTISTAVPLLAHIIIACDSMPFILM